MPTEIRNHAQTQGDDTLRHSQAANTVHKELATKRITNAVLQT